MSRVCQITGKAPMVGNNVSHANNKTKRRFKKTVFFYFLFLTKIVFSHFDTKKAAMVDSINTAIKIIIKYLLPSSTYCPKYELFIYLSIIS